MTALAPLTSSARSTGQSAEISGNSRTVVRPSASVTISPRYPSMTAGSGRVATNAPTSDAATVVKVYRAADLHRVVTTSVSRVRGASDPINSARCSGGVPVAECVSRRCPPAPACLSVAARARCDDRTRRPAAGTRARAWHGQSPFGGWPARRGRLAPATREQASRERLMRALHFIVGGERDNRIRHRVMRDTPAIFVHRDVVPGAPIARASRRSARRRRTALSPAMLPRTVRLQWPVEGEPRAQSRSASDASWKGGA